METTTRIWKTEELRVVAGSEGEPVRITGVAVPYNTLSEDLGGFREQFLPGAFGDSLHARNLRADVEHERTQLLGRTDKSTLVFNDGPDKLRATITLPGTTLGQDTLENVRNGNLDGMSVAFIEPEADWKEVSGGGVIRTIKKATLRAVTLTSYPAYRQTAGTLAERSLKEYLDGQRKDEKSKDDEPPPVTDNDVLRWRLDLAEAE